MCITRPHLVRLFLLFDRVSPITHMYPCMYSGRCALVQALISTDHNVRNSQPVIFLGAEPLSLYFRHLYE